MNEVDVINVLYHGSLVGRLTMGVDGMCLFQYDATWLNEGFAISPLKLPLEPKLFRANYLPFYGNFGVFEDSLPGGYGEYMLLKELLKYGIDYRSLTHLQRLSIVGHGGMGALCYEPAQDVGSHNETTDLDELQEAALRVLKEKSDAEAGLLYLQSGNSGGVRPKALLKDDEGYWLVKFRQTYDPINSGLVEYQYNEAAQKAGIVVPQFKLFEGRYFGVQRFDITPTGERIHMVSASGLLDEGINPPKMDYNTLLALTGYLTQDPKEVEQQFRRMIFNYYAENFDDHARNFSFLHRDGRWRLSPAYDMTHDSPLGEHATTVGYNSAPTDEEFIASGVANQIPRQRCREIMEEVRPIADTLLKTLKR